MNKHTKSEKKSSLGFWNNVYTLSIWTHNNVYCRVNEAPEMSSTVRNIVHLFYSMDHLALPSVVLVAQMVSASRVSTSENLQKLKVEQHFHFFTTTLLGIVRLGI